jgi:transposase
MGLQAKSVLLADRGYDADWIGALVNQQGAWANIPPKRNRKDPRSALTHPTGKSFPQKYSA